MRNVLAMNLYFIKAHDYDLWVRAADEDRAFEFWVWYYELHEGGTLHTVEDDEGYSREEAEDDYDFAIELKKTYADPVPAEGAINWEDAHRMTVEAL